jgi:hypothetical protein
MRPNGVLKVGEKDMVIFDVSFNANTMSVSFAPKAAMPIRQYESNPQIINLDRIRETLNRNGEAKIENILCGGGSSIILELPDGVQYFISNYRDSKAPRFPNTIDSLGGIVNTPNPIYSSIREFAEEVIVVDGNSAVIPQFPPGPWSEYNGLINGRVSSLSKQFGITDTHLSYGRMAPLKESLHLDGREDMSVGVALIELVLGGPLTAVVIVTPPLIIKQDSLGSFRETLEIETKGGAPERDVVLIKITENHSEQPDVIVYNKGKRMEEHLTFSHYTEKKFNGKLAVASCMAATFKYIGLEKHPAGQLYRHPMLPELRV